MPKLTLKKASLNLYEEDIETIKKHYPDAGYQQIIRTLTHNLAEQLREKEPTNGRGRTGKPPSD